MPLMLLMRNNVKTEGGAFWKESYYFFTRKSIYPLPWHYTHYRQWNVYLWNVQIFKNSRGSILFAYKFLISNKVVVTHNKCWKGAANAKNPTNEGRAPKSCPKQCGPGTSLVVQWLRLMLPMQRAQVQSMVRELRSHMPQLKSSHDATKKRRRNASEFGEKFLSMSPTSLILFSTIVCVCSVMFNSLGPPEL